MGNQQPLIFIFFYRLCNHHGGDTMGCKIYSKSEIKKLTKDIEKLHIKGSTTIERLGYKHPTK